ncbi:hypothetical protein AB1Y20_009824 [Prymnesium parvum]|uniref:AB hydrolase-1 domain-containing protein n=1 Tax=Prymnesium parvum TaxID=97485 RepID=A0AB34K6G1_PRYPA
MPVLLTALALLLPESKGVSLRCSRCHPPKLTATASTSSSVPPPLAWSPSPDSTWLWKTAEATYTVNYIAVGDPEAEPMLLIHGFGASGFHWRRNVNVLADAGYRVYAIDLLGFGLSSKPVIEYDASIWRQQCEAFLREVAVCGDGKRALVAGNSIGGYTALSVGSAHPELVRGVVSLNGAGRFAPSPEEVALLAVQEAEAAARNPVQRAVVDLLASMATALQRAVAYAGLFVTKQPLRIKQVLRTVYPVNPDAADDELVASIQYPADDEMGLAPPGQIPEVFYRIVTRNARGGTTPIDSLLEQLEVPLLLLWGEQDPWIVSKTGDRIQMMAEAMGKDVRRISVNAGHCPQDEAPEEVNTALLEFAQSLGK